jgi:hypothetical protein
VLDLDTQYSSHTYQFDDPCCAYVLLSLYNVVVVSDISVDIGLKLHGQAVEKRNHVDMLSTCRVVPPEDLCLLTAVLCDMPVYAVSALYNDIFARCLT